MKRMVLLALVLACNQTPTPIGPSTPWISVKCPQGGYCDARSEVCGVKGHACDENSCCFIGDNGRAYGTSKGRPQSKEPITQ